MLPVSFHFEGSPCVDATFLGAALGVRLAERRSCEARFSVMGETQVGGSFLRMIFEYLHWRKRGGRGSRPQ